MFIYGLNTSTGSVVYSTLMQSQVPEEIRGRVYTLLDAEWNVMRLVSLGAGGLLVDRWGIRNLFYLGGLLLAAAGLLGLVLFRDYQFKEPSERQVETG